MQVAHINQCTRQLFNGCTVCTAEVNPLKIEVLNFYQARNILYRKNIYYLAKGFLNQSDVMVIKTSHLQILV